MTFAVLTNPSADEQKQMTDIMTEAFVHNGLVYNEAFHKNKKRMHDFMEICVLFSARTPKSDFYVAYDDEGKMCAVAIWRYPNSPSLTFKMALKAKIVHKIVALDLKSPRSALRASVIDEIDDRHHYRGKHYYLFYLASVKKGAGRELMDYCLKSYEGNDLYLESEGLPNNYEFYKSLGFELLDESIIYGYHNGYLLKRADNRA